MRRRHFCLVAVFVLASSFAVAADRAHDSEAIVAEIDSLRVAYRTGAALAKIEEALPAARRTGDRELLLSLVSRKGELLVAIGRAAEGLPVLAESIDLAEALADSLMLCEGLRWRGVAFDATGEAEMARRSCLRLLAVAQACGRPEHEAWAQVGLGWQALRTGAGTEALDRYRKAVSCFEDVRPVNAQRADWGLAWGWNGVGSASRALGDYGTAVDAYERSAAAARRIANGVGESMAVNNLGTLEFALGDPGSALVHFSRARDLQLRFGHYRGAIMPALNVAFCRMNLGRWGAAETDLDSLATVCREQGFVDYEAMIRNAQGDLAVNRGRPNQAVLHYRATLDLPEGLPLKNRVEARIGLARALGALGRHEEALAELACGRREIAGRDLFDRELRLRADSAVHLQDLGRHEEALDLLFAVNETARSRGLTDYRIRALSGAAASCRALGRPDSCLTLLREAALVWQAERSLPLDPEWRERRGQSGRLVSTDLAAAVLEGDSDAAEADAFDVLQIFKARTLLERMHGPGSVADSTVASLEAVTLEDVRRRCLEPGELLLDAYLGPTVSFLFAVTRTECRVVELPAEDELGRRVQGFNDFVSRPPRLIGDDETVAMARQAGASLRQLLLGEVEDLLAGHRHVFFAPDGALNLLSPATLSRSGEETSWSRIPSATVLTLLRRKGTTPPTRGRALVLVGGRDQTSDPLPGAVREAERLAGRFHGVDMRVCRRDSMADTELRQVSALRGYEVLHLATHAHADDESPWQSSISLPGFGRDGRLTAAEIAASRLDARLAVLAACESGSGRVLSGEGVLGLSSAFLSAGVPAVVATLWSVDDATTSYFMDRFYGEIAGGRNAAEALRAAREDVRARRRTSHPFFWAGYILVGDGGVRPELERNRPLRHAIAGALGLLAAVLLLYSFRRRT